MPPGGGPGSWNRPPQQRFPETAPPHPLNGVERIAADMMAIHLPPASAVSPHLPPAAGMLFLYYCYYYWIFVASLANFILLLLHIQNFFISKSYF